MRPDTKSQPALNRFVRMMRDVIRQRRLLEPWKNDMLYASGDKHIFQALDSDAVVFFISTSENAVDRFSNGKFEGYSQIFRSDEKDLATALGWKLADRIFLGESGNPPPRLILPPINEEINGIFKAIHRKAESQASATWWDHSKLEGILRNIQDSQNNDQLNDLKRQKNNILNNLTRKLLATENATEQLYNFRILAKHASLGTPEHLIANNKLKLTEDEATAFKAPEEIEDLVHFYSLRDDWLERLHTKASGLKLQIRIARDALALARLEFINEKLRRMTDDSSKLVMITGANYVDNAALGYSPEIASGKSFAEAFLRHPRAYLDDVVTPLASCADELAECPASPSFILWLDTQLAEFCFLNTKHSNYNEWVKLEKELDEYLKSIERGKSKVPEKIKKVVDKFEDIIESFPNAVDKLQNRWREYLKWDAIGVLGAEKFRKLLDGSIGERPSHPVRLSETIESLIKNKEFSRTYGKLLNEDWRECYYSAVTSGRGFLYDSVPGSTSNRSRCIPPTRLDSTFPEAANFVASLLEGSINDGRTESELLDELEREDETGYTYFIANAQLFASQGAWPTAYGLAQWARDIADIKKADSGHHKIIGSKSIDGREAAYLMAVTRRYTSTGIDHLDQSSKFLSEFKRIMDQEDDKASGYYIDKGEHERLLDLIRYDAERVGLNMSYRMFEIFCGKTAPEEIPGVDDLIKELVELFRKRFSELNAFNDGIRTIEGRITNCVGRLLVVYTINALLIKRFLRKEDISTHELPMHQMLEYLHHNLQERPMRSYTVNVLSRIGDLWFGEITAKSKNELRQLLEDDTINQNALMPYDRERGKFYKQAVREISSG